MNRIMIHAVFNKAEKSAEFITSTRSANTLEELLGDNASKYTWLRPFKDKKGSYPSKWMLNGLSWEDLQALKQLSKATGSGSDRSIRIWTGKSHLDLAWSGEYIYEDCSYWVHVTGPLHWKSIDILEQVLYRYLQGCRLLEFEDIFNAHLLMYMDAYRNIPYIFEVENALWDEGYRFELFSDFNSPGVYSTSHVTSNDWLLQINVISNRKLRLTAHKLGTPWEHTEQLAEITYGDHWRESLKSEFLKAVKEYSSK